MMKQEWCCTSTAIAQTKIVFITSNLRRAQNAYVVFHQNSSDAIILHDNMLASALDKVDTFAGEVVLEKISSTAIMQKATPAERIDLRISSQPEVPYTQDEKYETSLLIS